MQYEHYQCNGRVNLVSCPAKFPAAGHFAGQDNKFTLLRHFQLGEGCIRNLVCDCELQTSFRAQLLILLARSSTNILVVCTMVCMEQRDAGKHR